MKKHKNLKRVLIALVAIILLIIGGFIIYTSNYYHADFNVEEFVTNVNDVKVTTKNEYTIVSPKQPTDTGFIFYPGGKVEETSYLPLLEKLAQEGITCVLVKMPFRLAVFGIDRADDIFDLLPEVTDWYIGGHSLGGAMASSYALKHEDVLSGVILLGAYATGELNIPVITIYGSNDGVINREKLSTSPNRKEIEGGNHAYYGNYGEQAGDGTATITRQEQQENCVDLITEFMSAQVNNK